MASAISGGDRLSLSLGITLVESKRDEDVKWSSQLLSIIENKERISKCIAITGPPGAGKSSFIEEIGQLAIEEQMRVAVLSIDPSSELSGGSILGDKTRMPNLAASDMAYIRPSPSSGILGGVNDRTWEVRQLCNAAGYDYIFVETVGVGQAESEVRHLTDMVVVLVQPGAGDDIQGIKKGLNEIADFFVVNKSDGEQVNLARETKSAMIHSTQLGEHKFNPEYVVLNSIQDEDLLTRCWGKLKACYKSMEDSGMIKKRVEEQHVYWFKKKSGQMLLNWLTGTPAVRKSLQEHLDRLTTGKLNFNESLSDFIDEIKRKCNLD